MGRAKLDMKFIKKEKTRNTTFEKRKNGMLKKADEFKTLCDVDTAVIIYPPNSKTPEIWPENPDVVKNSIASYKAKYENGKRSYGVIDYFEERKKKMEDELVKARKRNMEAKYATWFDELDGLSEGELRHFAMGLEKKENLVRDYLEFQKRSRSIEPVDYKFQLHAGGSHLQGVDQVQMVNHHLMNHGAVGWFDGAPTTSSFIPEKNEVGHGYGNYNIPLFEGSVVNGYSIPWLMFQPPPVVQGGVMPELAVQEFDSQLNNGVGDFVMDDYYRGRYLG
ncbi:hypothetical protein LXL04_035111 [Taraxacum kok-saghyz]